MIRLKTRTAIAALVLAGVISAPALSPAIVITETSDPFGLANSLFLNVGGLAIQSASFSGSFGQAGTYNER